MPRPALWTAIAETLREEIAARHYQPGDKLPTEAEMSARFEVNRHTVRRALAALAEDGMVTSRRGAGAFVTVEATGERLDRHAHFTTNILGTGQTPKCRIQVLHTSTADGATARALELETGSPVHICEGISIAGDQPVGLFRSRFPAKRFPNLLSRLQTVPSISQALRAEGFTGDLRTSTQLTATLANASQAEHLQVSLGAAVLHCETINSDPDGKPVEYRSTWFAGDPVTLNLNDENP